MDIWLSFFNLKAHLDSLVGPPELEVVPVLHQEGHQAQDEACSLHYIV